MDISAERYVSITSYKRDGGAVPVAVWIAPLADGRVGFTTDGGSFKAKRIRRNPAVTLRPCDMRGNVAAEAPELAGTAVVLDEGPDLDAVTKAIAKKYGIQAAAVTLGSKLKALIGRPSQHAAIVVTLDTPT